jgi:DNA-binding beta-propeller fold protein YncE
MKVAGHVLLPATVKRNTRGIDIKMIHRLIIVLLFFSINLYGQNTAELPQSDLKDDPFFKWIGNFPDAKSYQKIGFFEKILNFITGSEPVLLNNPVFVYAIDKENYFVANQGSGKIVQFKQGDNIILPAFKKQSNYFPSLVCLSRFSEENMLFTDSKLNKVFLLSTDGKIIKPLNVGLTLDRPTGIAYSQKQDEIWVVETGLHQISVLNRKGELKKVIGHRGTGNLEFNFPTYIWIDSDGKIYIVDSMNFRIQVLTSGGEYITSFGKQGDATGSFARPRGIATDSKGNIYVVDALFNNVQIFDISGHLLYYFGSQGNGKYKFWMPSGIFIDRDDFIYISDSYNGKVQIFQLVKK